MATLTCPAHFDASTDADAIWQACKGPQKDEKVMIQLLGHRDEAQRKLIKEIFEEKYNEDLIQCFDSCLFGDFGRVVELWMLDSRDRLAVLVHDALKKSDYTVFIELCCNLSEVDQIALCWAYQARFNRRLEEHAASVFPQSVGKPLVLLMTTYRCETKEIDNELAKKEAGILQNFFKDRMYNEDDMVRILSTRSRDQLNATFKYLDDVYGIPDTYPLYGPAAGTRLNLVQEESSSLKIFFQFGLAAFGFKTKSARVVSLASGQSSGVINSNQGGDDFAEVVRVMIQCLKSPPNYLAKVLSDALGSHSIDKDALTRVVVTRAEIDLAEIKKIFYKRNRETLDHAVAKKTSGNYKKFILTILGHEDDH